MTPSQPRPSTRARLARAMGLSVLAALVCLALPLIAQQKPPATGAASAERMELTARDLKGAEVKVPQADRPSLVLFLRTDQAQSRQAIEDTKAALRDLPEVQVVVIVSGQVLEPEVRKFAADLPWPVATDPEFTVVGQWHVRVWPTSVVVQSDGTELTRLRGLPQTYARDLSAYLAFAAGKIDRKTLDQKLASTEVIADTPQQKAARHLQVAQRLLEKGLPDQAWQEVDQGLKLQPEDPRLRLTKARILLLKRDPLQSLSLLEGLDEKTALGQEIRTLKGGSLVALKRLDQAIPTLQAAVKLNPNPAEAYYYLGQAYQLNGQWSDAAGAFRLAFEASAEGRALATTPRAGQIPPASQP